MNVGIGTVTAQFLFWEYLFPIFGIVSLKCTVEQEYEMNTTLAVAGLPACHTEKIKTKREWSNHNDSTR
jgi:hypothetical protein